MLLDGLFSPKEVQKRPWIMLFIGFVYAGLAMPIAYFVDRTHSSMIMVILTVMASMPFIYNTLKYEEKKDENCCDERKLLKEHSKAIMSFLFLFIGITLAFSFGKIFLPPDVTDQLFSSQDTTIRAMNDGIIVGECQKSSLTTNFYHFLGYISHNMVVLILSILFAFIYGLGAIYIIVWNASILGLAIGNFVSTNLGKLSSVAGAEGIQGYFQVYSCAYFIRYLPHGIIEIAAYLVAGLAGGIISIAIIRHTFGTKKFTTVLIDSVDLIAISILLLAIAAFVEAFITIDVLCVWLCT